MSKNPPFITPYTKLGSACAHCIGVFDFSSYVWATLNYKLLSLTKSNLTNAPVRLLSKVELVIFSLNISIDDGRPMFYLDGLYHGNCAVN